MYHWIKHKKTIAKLVCILFIAAIFLSMIYIVKEANHDCIGDHCPICAHIQIAERTIGELGTAVILLAHVGAAVAILAVIIFHFTGETVPLTLVAQNVRMNN